jgi:hypothetical protein
MSTPPSAPSHVRPARVAGGMRIAGHSPSPTRAAAQAATATAPSVDPLAVQTVTDDAQSHALSSHIFDFPQARTNKSDSKISASTYNPPQKQVVEKRFVKNHHVVQQPGGAQACNRF